LLFTTFRPRPLNREPLGFLFVSTLAATMVKSYSFNPLWMMNITIFQETSNLYHSLKPTIGRLFQNIILVRSLRVQFHRFIQLCEETLQHFARFWRLFLSLSHVIDYSFFFLPFLFFFSFFLFFFFLMVTSD